MDTRFNVRTFLDPRDDEGHLIAKRVSEKRVATLAARSAESVGDDFFPIEITEAPLARFEISRAETPMRHRWILRDRMRPAYRGAFPSHARALHAADGIVRVERGAPSLPFFTSPEIIDEITARRQLRNAPCSVLPILPAEYVEEGVNR